MGDPEMIALVVEKGSPYLCRDYPVPVPSPDEALIRVKYGGICRTDLEILKGYMDFQGIIGHEFVGVVEDCKKRDLIGKRVTGEINISCGKCNLCQRGLRNHCPERSVLGILNKDGTFAEYITLPVENLHIVPDSLSDEEAVFTEPLAAAFEILEQIHITRKDRVCVLGDGKLGLLIAQVLYLTGCDLTVVGRHEEKLSILKTRGITSTLTPPGTNLFDIVVDATGSPEGLNLAMEMVRPRGIIVLKTTVARRDGIDLNRIVIDEITLIGSRCGPFRTALHALESRAVDVKSLISKIFPIDEGITALEYAGTPGVIKVLLRMTK